MEYAEELTSPKTGALFLALALLCLVLLTWRVIAAGWGALAFVLLFFTCMFLFYTVNYRTLSIRITAQALRLRFGVFTWAIPLENVANARLDELPALQRLGGAGIHFMTVGGRYRASFNFLEYPRVVIALKRKAGLVRDVSFSTRRPQEVLRALCEPHRPHGAEAPC